MSAVVHADHVALKRFLGEHVYRHYRVLRMTAKARQVLKNLFDALFDDLRLLPEEYADNARAAEAELGKAGRARAVADYVAGMTDRFAMLEHRRLFDPGERT